MSMRKVVADQLGVERVGIMVCGKKEKATMVGRMMRRMIWRAMSCVVGPMA